MNKVDHMANETARLKDHVVTINTEMNSLIINVQQLSKRCDTEQNPETKLKMMLELEQSMKILQGLKEASSKIMSRLDMFCDEDYITQMMQEEEDQDEVSEKKPEIIEHTEKDNLDNEEYDEDFEEMDEDELKMIQEIKRMENEKAMMQQSLLLKKQQRQLAALEVKKQKERDAIVLIEKMEKLQAEKEAQKQGPTSQQVEEKKVASPVKVQERKEINESQEILDKVHANLESLDTENATQEEKMEMANQYELIMKLLEIKAMQEQKIRIEEEMLKQENELKAIEQEEEKLKLHLESQKNTLETKTQEKDKIESEMFGDDSGANNEDMKKMLLIEEMKLLQEMLAKKEALEKELSTLEAAADEFQEAIPEEIELEIDGDDSQEMEIDGDEAQEIEIDGDEAQEIQARKEEQERIRCELEGNEKIDVHDQEKFKELYEQQTNEMEDLKNEEKKLQELIAAKEEEQKKIELQVLLKEQEEMLQQLEAMKTEKEKQIVQTKLQDEEQNRDLHEKVVENAGVDLENQDDSEILALLNSTPEEEMTPEMIEEKIKILELIEQKQEMERMLLEAEQEKMYNEMEMFKKMNQLKGAELAQMKNTEPLIVANIKDELRQQDGTQQQKLTTTNEEKLSGTMDMIHISKKEDPSYIRDDDNLHDEDDIGTLDKLKAIENQTEEQMNDPEVQARILQTLQDFEARKSQLEELIKMQEMQLEMQQALEQKEKMLAQTISLQEEQLAVMKQGGNVEESIENQVEQNTLALIQEDQVVDEAPHTDEERETLAEIHRLEAELREKQLQQQKEEELTKELEKLLMLEETAIKELTLKQQMLEKEYLQEELKIKESMVELNTKAFVASEKEKSRVSEKDDDLQQLRNDIGEDETITENEKADMIAKIEEQLSKKLKELD